MKLPIALIVGTRPEAIKMAPVHRTLLQSDILRPIVISTGQHYELLQTALSALGMTPDHDLEIMTPGQTSAQVMSRVVEGITNLLRKLAPAALLVQGDTTSVHAAALAGYFEKIPVGHVEAGLRTYDHANPFPEEANRQIVDRISHWCFAPTEGARQNLLAERIGPEHIYLTGNTAVDSILWAMERSRYRCETDTLLVTLHRQESFGEPLRNILAGICDFLDATPESRALWPVHPNPRVGEAIESLGAQAQQFQLVEPMDYVTFAGALGSCRLVLTDSGGIQEEAPSLGKRVLVTRACTERPEALGDEFNRLVDRSRVCVSEALTACWEARPHDGPLPAPNPFGDGHAAERIVDALQQSLA